MAPKQPNSPTGSALALDGGALDFVQVEQVAREGRPVTLSARAVERIAGSRATLEGAIRAGEPLYGVNTGFGSLSRKRIEDARLSEMQHNLLRSHAAGTGELLEPEVVRATMLLLAASLSRGHSGVRSEVVETLIDLLNAGVTPVVPAVGSVGASGDLAPLAHIALVLIGEGEALVGGERIGGAEAIRGAGIPAMTLAAKEGLALINGTHVMGAQAALVMSDVERVFDAAISACAMSIDAGRATDAFLDARAHDARNQRGQQRVAARLRTQLKGSQIIPSHIKDDPRVQDPYSLRCAPQVLGAVLDTIDHCRAVFGRELGAVTDNPLVFDQPGADGVARPIVSAGNFHGMPLAIALDALAIALCHVAGIAERRVFNLLSAADPESNLRAHLSPMPGLHSGLMITQYTAAACVNEMVGLATPASVANITTCAGMEDYNSFGPRSAAKARRATDLCARVVAIELLCAGEALEYHRPLQSGGGVERAHATIRRVVSRLEADRPPAPDIEALARLVLEGRFGD